MTLHPDFSSLAGGTVEFLHYADEGHKISKLVNRVDSFTRMAAFLDRVS